MCPATLILQSIKSIKKCIKFLNNFICFKNYTSNTIIEKNWTDTENSSLSKIYYKSTDTTNIPTLN